MSARKFEMKELVALSSSLPTVKTKPKEGTDPLANSEGRTKLEQTQLRNTWSIAELGGMELERDQAKARHEAGKSTQADIELLALVGENDESANLRKDKRSGIGSDDGIVYVNGIPTFKRVGENYERMGFSPHTGEPLKGGVDYVDPTVAQAMLKYQLAFQDRKQNDERMQRFNAAAKQSVARHAPKRTPSGLSASAPQPMFNPQQSYGIATSLGYARSGKTLLGY